MRISLFDTFAAMIERTPAKAVLRAVELECRMLEDDLINHREEFLEEAFSLRNFHFFLRAAKGEFYTMFPSSLPVEHMTFYRRTIARLIEAEELPVNTDKRFDETFSNGKESWEMASADR